MPVNREWIESIWASYLVHQCIGGWADFTWYAVDGGGNVGFLASSGSGGVPGSIFADIDAYIAAMEFMAALPIVGEITLLKQFPCTDDWIVSSKRGLYGFDHADTHGSKPSTTLTEYDLISVPQRPILVHDLPRWLQEWLQPFTFVKVRFQDGANGPLDFATEGVRWIS